MQTKVDTPSEDFHTVANRFCEIRPIEIIYVLQDHEVKQLSGNCSEERASGARG